MKDARAVAQSMVGTNARILEEKTLTTSFGWVFFYESVDFLTTGNRASRLVGNAPILVDGRTGTACFTGTAFAVEEYIDAYEHVGGEATKMMNYIKERRKQATT